MSDPVNEPEIKNFVHRPVMVAEVLENLVTRIDGIYIDGTLGVGGHAEAILQKISKEGRLIGIDRDAEVLQRAQERLKVYGDRIQFFHGTYDQLGSACRILNVSCVDGILIDLGVSSPQLDHADRGFSFSREARLDMRMDRSETETAASLLNKISAYHLEDIIRNFGEEPFAPRIARAIVQRRRQRPVETTTDLAQVVSQAIPRRAWPTRIHPATRTFQALRIAVNHELEYLDHLLKKAPQFLKVGGRLSVLAYHSLEDRLVKRSLLQWEREGILRRISKKVIFAREVEVRENPRARSARFRVAEKKGESL